MNTTTNLTVANEISRQIGSSAFFMMGTRYQVGDEKSLAFDVRGSRKCNKVKITLAAGDTYTVEFFKMTSRGLDCKTVAEVDMIHGDGLRQVIESKTGLLLSL